MITIYPSPFMKEEIKKKTTQNFDLLHKSISRDANEFWELWGKYQDDILLRYCLHWMGGNRADAEDALSEASLRAYQGWLTKAPELTNIKGWFLRIVKNHCINIQKTRTRQSRVVQGVEDVTQMANKADEDGLGSPEDTALRHEMGQHIRLAIDDLPPRLREPTKLYFLQDVSYSDIAIRLSLSPTNVRKRIQLARTLLRARIVTYLAGKNPVRKRICLRPTT